MAERHTRQNDFHGTPPPGERRPGRGGSRLSDRELMGYYMTLEERDEYERHVLERDGARVPSCWCDGAICDGLGNWPGSDRGEPHPREPEHDTIERPLTQERQ